MRRRMTLMAGGGVEIREKVQKVMQRASIEIDKL